MTRTTSSLMVVALALFLVLPASAQDHDHAEGQAHDNTAFLENYTKDFDGASKKLTDLAGAMPADMYGWQPAEGIRSVSEVYMHVALARTFPRTVAQRDTGAINTDCKNPSLRSSIIEIVEKIAVKSRMSTSVPGM